MKDKYENILKENMTLETKRLKLRAFTENDAKDVYEYAKDEETVKFLTWPVHESLEESLKVIKEIYSELGTYAIEVKENNKCIGCIGLMLSLEHDKTSFGYVLNRDYWGKGYMSEALNEVLRFCFEKLKLNRVEATYYVGNKASGRVMEKCNMKYEGRGLSEIKIKGEYVDVEHMAILRKDWIKKS